MAGKVSSDPNIFLLPDIGEGLQEAELIKWLVSEGDTVEENQTIAEVETDKALSEIPSPRAGVIATLHGAPGDMMQVGEPFVTYKGEGGKSAGGGEADGKGADNGSAKAQTKAQPQSKQAPVSEAQMEEAAEQEDAGTVVGQMGGAL